MIRLVFGISALMASGSAVAQDGGSVRDILGKPQAICSIDDVFECIADGSCEKVDRSLLELPPFFFVNVDDKRIVGVGGTSANPAKATPIDRLERLETVVVAQGGELDVAWSITVQRATGQMSMAAAAEGMTFSGFGTCAALPEE